jgi:hypothetical protein
VRSHSRTENRRLLSSQRTLDDFLCFSATTIKSAAQKRTLRPTPRPRTESEKAAALAHLRGRMNPALYYPTGRKSFCIVKARNCSFGGCAPESGGEVGLWWNLLGMPLGGTMEPRRSCGSHIGCLNKRERRGRRLLSDSVRSIRRGFARATSRSTFRSISLNAARTDADSRAFGASGFRS